jgi:ATP-binding cassette, subfamily B, bacterial
LTSNNTFLTAKLGRAAAQLPYLAKALSLVWRAAGHWSALWLALLVVQGLLPAATVYLTRSLVDSLAAVIGSSGDWSLVRPALWLAGGMGGLMLLGQLLSSLTSWVRTVQSELVVDHITALVHEQSIRLDLAFYDSAEYYDRLHRARAEAGYRPVMLLESLGGLFQNGITLIAMAAVLLPYAAWLPAGLLISTLPALFIILRYRAAEHQFRLRTTAIERRTWYYDWLLTARETAAELRLFALGDRFRAEHQALRRDLRGERFRLTRNEGLARLAASGFAMLVTAAVLAWMAWRAIRGQATLGDLALFYAAFNQGQGLMRSLLENLGQIYSNMLFLGNLFEFLELKPQVEEPLPSVPFPAFERGSGGQLAPSVRFRDVTFRYPGGGRAILAGLNLEVPAGQVAAIVGPNGAGKSTLIKLLCRFYDPEAGRVEINGVDLRELSTDTLRSRITVLFQEPVQYNASAAVNIAIGNGAERRADVEAAAQAAGADGPIARLPQGYDTLLGTWFEGGTDLSVGEWQRVALARAFLRRAPLVILDEPTSAMDSWAEADWLTRFRSLVAGRTAIIITHRFTTARYADVIHVMGDGHIVESGAHEELLAMGGRYARSWQAQTTPQWQAVSRVPAGGG